MNHERLNTTDNNDLRYAHDTPSASQAERDLLLATGEYTDAYRAGAELNAAEWLRSHPECDPRALVDWLLYFHCIAVDLPEPDPVPRGDLSASAQRAMARIREMQRQMNTDFN